MPELPAATGGPRPQRGWRGSLISMKAPPHWWSQWLEMCPPYGAAVALLTLLLAGCILPYPVPASGVRVDREAARLEVGMTTRDEARALLGAT